MAPDTPTEVNDLTLTAEVTPGLRAILNPAITRHEANLNMHEPPWTRAMFGTDSDRTFHEYARRTLVELRDKGAVSSQDLAARIEDGEFGDARLYVGPFNEALEKVRNIVVPYLAGIVPRADLSSQDDKLPLETVS